MVYISYIMYMNFWIILIILMTLYLTCFCVKKEFFEEPKETQGSVAKKKSTGTKYTIVDVNKAVDLIKKHFLKTENVHITITKVISIVNSPQHMTLKLFIYNPVKNVLYGNTVQVKLPLNKKEKGEILSVKKFTDDSEKNEYKDKQLYQPVSFINGSFI